MPFRRECDVAIIGAGAAGTAAARVLCAAHIDTIVLEARPRAGGRALTQIHAGFPIDLGCGWLHSADDNPFVDLARQFGFTIDMTPPPWREMMYEDAFSAQEQQAFRAAQAQFYARLEAAAAAPSDRPAVEFLDRGGRWSALIDAVCTYVNGCELDKLSTKDFDNYRDSEINYRVIEGYGALIARLAQETPVVFDCPVKRIDHSGPRIAIETDRGTLKARAVIVTTPTNVLAQEHLRLHPSLPDKLEAAAMLPLGIANKIFLKVERPQDLPANGRLFGKLDRTQTGAYHLLPFGRPLIEGYFGGAWARALENEGPAAFAAFAIAEICEMLGNDWRRRLTPLAASAWAGDPFALGSYSHALPGHWNKRAVLAAPVDERLFFAGEATHAHYFSTAHGAYESGARAASQALRALGG